jgi:hypothetical protein
MAHEAGAFKVNSATRGFCLPLALMKTHAGQAFSGDIAPKLRSGKCDAGNLASPSHLHKNYTICRLGIHF